MLADDDFIVGRRRARWPPRAMLLDDGDMAAAAVTERRFQRREIFNAENNMRWGALAERHCRRPAPPSFRLMPARESRATRDIADFRLNR